MKKRHQQKLAILALSLLFAFNLPLLLVFDSSASVMGLPLIYIYIFSVWIAVIMMSFIIFKRYYE